MKILKSKKKNDQIIYEYGNTFKSKLSLKYKTYDLKIYIYMKNLFQKMIKRWQLQDEKRRINLSLHRFRFFVSLRLGHVSRRFLHLFLLRRTNVCTYLAIAVIRSFCKMSVLRAPGKSRDIARIRVAGRWKFTSARQKRCDCFTG